MLYLEYSALTAAYCSLLSKHPWALNRNLLYLPRFSDPFQVGTNLEGVTESTKH